MKKINPRRFLNVDNSNLFNHADISDSDGQKLTKLDTIVGQLMQLIDDPKFTMAELDTFLDNVLTTKG